MQQIPALCVVRLIFTFVSQGNVKTNRSELVPGPTVRFAPVAGLCVEGAHDRHASAEHFCAHLSRTTQASDVTAPD